MTRFRQAEATARIRSSHPDDLCLEVDVLPAQRKQFSTPESCHGCGEVQRLFEASELRRRRCAQQRLKLIGVQIADIAVVLVTGLINRSHWVCRTPTSLQCECEDRVQQAEVVADALDRLCLDSFG